MQVMPLQKVYAITGLLRREVRPQFRDRRLLDPVELQEPLHIRHTDFAVNRTQLMQTR